MSSNTLEQSKSRSPMMQQWFDCKQKAQDALVLFRMGDFYEAFEKDAQELAQFLDLTLTKRQGIPMAGVPVVSLDTTLAKLAEKKCKVALVEQLEDPKQTKGIVHRDIVRVITPGSWVPEEEQKQHAFLLSLCEHKGQIGIVYGDLSTGQWTACTSTSLNSLQTDLCRLKPKEILLANKWCAKNQTWIQELQESLGFAIQSTDDWNFDPKDGFTELCRHYNLHNLDCMGLKDQWACFGAAGAWLRYVRDDLRHDIRHLQKLTLAQCDDYMYVDKITLRNLEIVEPLYIQNQQSTLLNCLDNTLSSMGARKLREWLLHPLTSHEQITQRQQAVSELIEKPQALSALRQELCHVRDLERLGAKIACRQANPKDLIALQSTLAHLPAIQDTLKTMTKGVWQELSSQFQTLQDLEKLLSKAISPEAPLRLHDGDVIAPGWSQEIDQWRQIRDEGHNWLLDYQNQLKQELDIKNLKVGYTPAFGYYIEVSKGQAALVPETFRRRQTLVGSERFITPSLKEFEDKVLHAKEKIQRLQADTYQQLLEDLCKTHTQLAQSAHVLAHTDVLAAFAFKAKQFGYCCPKVDDSQSLVIEKGRHPVVEEKIGQQNFVANSTCFDSKTCQVCLITGPNMAGKSTYIRQVAVLCLMAQIGSYVPAEKMHLGVLDRIFTRVGASDDLARGQSTFMVEMTEAANILNHASERSLVVLDEVGRGTSTSDGIAIAQAIAEHILTHSTCRPKTLFATHYWELTQLSEKFKRLKNFHIAIKEEGKNITFLHSIVAGSSDKSYGIHVAELAGIPQSVIQRAWQIHHCLKKQDGQNTSLPDPQLSLFQLTPTQEPTHQTTILDELRSLEPEKITPLDALWTLHRWKTLSQNDSST